jgi:hypothetical protein
VGGDKSGFLSEKNLSEMISIRQRKRKKKGADEEKVLRRKRVMLKLFFNTIKHAFRYDEGIKT